MTGEYVCMYDDFKEEGFEYRKEGFKEMIDQVDICVKSGGEFHVSHSLEIILLCAEMLY